MQLTSDAFVGYTGVTTGVPAIFGNDVDYATETKTYGQVDQNNRRKRFNPVVCLSCHREARIGNPNIGRATTNHVERTNLSVRLFNRRFTRKTMGFSKKLENHRWAVILQTAHFNFCRVHSSIAKTPAMAFGLTDHVWKVEELLAGVA